MPGDWFSRLICWWYGCSWRVEDNGDRWCIVCHKHEVGYIQPADIKGGGPVCTK